MAIGGALSVFSPTIGAHAFNEGLSDLWSSMYSCDLLENFSWEIFERHKELDLMHGALDVFLNVPGFGVNVGAVGRKLLAPVARLAHPIERAVSRTFGKLVLEDKELMPWLLEGIKDGGREFGVKVDTDVKKRLDDERKVGIYRRFYDLLEREEKKSVLEDCDERTVVPELSLEENDFLGLKSGLVGVGMGFKGGRAKRGVDEGGKRVRRGVVEGGNEGMEKDVVVESRNKGVKRGVSVEKSKRRDVSGAERSTKKKVGKGRIIEERSNRGVTKEEGFKRGVTDEERSIRDAAENKNKQMQWGVVTEGGSKKGVAKEEKKHVKWAVVTEERSERSVTDKERSKRGVAEDKNKQMQWGVITGERSKRGVAEEERSKRDETFKIEKRRAKMYVSSSYKKAKDNVNKFSKINKKMDLDKDEKATRDVITKDDNKTIRNRMGEDKRYKSCVFGYKRYKRAAKRSININDKKIRSKREVESVIKIVNPLKDDTKAAVKDVTKAIETINTPDTGNGIKIVHQYKKFNKTPAAAKAIPKLETFRNDKMASEEANWKLFNKDTNPQVAAEILKKSNSINAEFLEQMNEILPELLQKRGEKNLEGFKIEINGNSKDKNVINLPVDTGSKTNVIYNGFSDLFKALRKKYPVLYKESEEYFKENVIKSIQEKSENKINELAEKVDKYDYEFNKDTDKDLRSHRPLTPRQLKDQLVDGFNSAIVLINKQLAVNQPKDQKRMSITSESFTVISKFCTVSRYKSLQEMELRSQPVQIKGFATERERGGEGKRKKGGKYGFIIGMHNKLGYHAPYTAYLRYDVFKTGKDKFKEAGYVLLQREGNECFPDCSEYEEAAEGGRRADEDLRLIRGLFRKDSEAL